MELCPLLQVEAAPGGRDLLPRADAAVRRALAARARRQGPLRDAQRRRAPQRRHLRTLQQGRPGTK